MSWQLTEGALSTIMRGGTVEDPVMQILGSKKIAGAGSSERYRLLVSDGCHLNSFAMLATQLNDKLTSGELSDYSVVRINRLITSMVNNSGRGEKRVMIILDLTVLAKGTEVGLKIGNPVAFPDGGSSAAPAQPSRPSATSPMPKPSLNGGAMPSAKITHLLSRNTPSAPQLSSSPADGHIHPIASLSPYQNKWVIKARVVNKTPVKTWSNARGEGKLFSMELVDETGEIRATAFKEQCDKFYELIEVLEDLPVEEHGAGPSSGTSPPQPKCKKWLISEDTLHNVSALLQDEKDEADECRAFAKYMTCKLRKLTAIQRRATCKKLTEVLHKAEMDFYRNNK